MTRLTTILRAVLAAAVVVCPSASAAQSSSSSSGTAQQPSSTGPAQSAAAGSGQGSQSKAVTSDVYTYNSEGRRDPFVSLLFRGSDLRPARESRPDGLPGLMINEVSLRGILKDKMGFVAMVSGPDNKTHIIRGNDKLFDGSVKAITADSVIFSQDVNDPLSLVKQREVRKYLRATQEGK